MSDFKKLPCLAGCPTDSGLVDCDGKAINLGDAVARCSDIPEATVVSISGTKPTGNAIGTVTIDGVPTILNETVTTLVSVTFDEATRTLSVTYKGEDGVEVTREDNIPAISAVVHIAPAVITPPTKYPEYYNQIVTDANGNFWGFSINGTPTLLNIVETITSIYDILAYANKHEIFKYKNESALIKSVYETVTTLKSLAYVAATGVLTAVYTDENGADITKTATIKGQATAFFNGTTPSTATIFSLVSPPTVDDPTLKQNDDYVLVGTDGSTWYWNGTAYVTAPAPVPTTEWLLAGTTVDAGSNKTAKIARTGWVTIGKNVAASAPLDVYNTGVTAYSMIARFLNPDNKVAGNNTQMVFGAAHEAGNAADWRFFYAGNNSPLNRIDLGFSGYASPNISYLVNGRTGIRNATPTSTFHVTGSVAASIRLSPGGTTLTESDFSFVMSSAGSTTTLPAPTGMDGRIYVVKNSSTGVCSVTGAIDSTTVSTISIPAKGSRIFQALSGYWFIIGAYL